MSGVDKLPSLSPLLAIERREDGDGITLRVSGELDLASTPQLEAALEQARAVAQGPLTLDLAGLEFMDSTGMAALARAHHASARTAHPIILAHPGAQVRRLLALAGMLEQFDVRD